MVEAVERAFERLSRGLARWPDPHQERRPDDDDYSRVTNAARYRIVGARADAWAAGLEELGLATLETDVEWAEQPQTDFRRPFMIVPEAAGALAVVVARHRLGDRDDAGVTLGAGRPAVPIAFFPDCGCDACDWGSEDAIELVDQYLRAIVTGRYRRLSKGNEVIAVVGESRSSSNVDWRRAEAVLARPEGWSEIAGTTWLPPTTDPPRTP